MSDEPEARRGDPSDGDLLSAARAGDRGALTALHARHAEAARAVAQQFTRSDADAERLAAEAMAGVDAAIAAGGGPEVAYRMFVFASVRRLAVAGGTGADDGGLEPPAGGAAAGRPAPEVAETPAALAYAALPERWRAVLWYTEVERLPIDQTAHLLGMSEGAVATLSHLAHEGLREEYLRQHVAGAPTKACAAITPLLSAHVGGQLGRRDTARVRDHLETCPYCRAAVADLRDVDHGVQGFLVPLVLGAAGLGALSAPLPVGGWAAGSAGSGGGAVAAASDGPPAVEPDLGDELAAVGAGASGSEGAGADADAGSRVITAGVAAAVTAGIVGISLAVAGLLDDEPEDGDVPVTAEQSVEPSDDAPAPTPTEPDLSPSPQPSSEPTPTPIPSEPAPEPLPSPTPPPQAAPAPRAAVVPAPDTVEPDAAPAPEPTTPRPSEPAAGRGATGGVVRPVGDADPPAVPVAPAPPSSPAVPAPQPPAPEPPAPGPAALEATVSGADVTLTRGTVGTVSVDVANTGESPATDVRAVLTLPDGVVPATAGPVGAWAPCGDGPAGRVELCLPELGVGTSSQVSVGVRLADAGVVAPEAVIGVRVGATTVDPVEVVVPVTVGPDASELTLVMPEAVQLPVGEPGPVTFAVGNAGAAPAQDVVASVTLPAGVSWSGPTGTTVPWDCAQEGEAVRCTVGEVAGASGDTPALLELSLTVVAQPEAAGATGLAIDVTVSAAAAGSTLTGSVPIDVAAPVTPEPTPAPMPAPTREPTPEPTPGPAAEPAPTPVPAPEPTPVPTPDPTPTTPATAPQPTPDSTASPVVPDGSSEMGTEATTDDAQPDVALEVEGSADVVTAP